MGVLEALALGKGISAFHGASIAIKTAAVGGGSATGSAAVLAMPPDLVMPPLTVPLVPHPPGYAAGLQPYPYPAAVQEAAHSAGGLDLASRFGGLTGRVAALAESTVAALRSTTVQDSVRALIAPVCTVSMTAGVGAWLRHKWMVEDGVVEEDDEELRGMVRWAPSLLSTLALNDSYMVGVILNSLGQHLATPLRTWAAGGVLLSWPATWLVARVTAQHGIRIGFVAETGAVIVSFFWLSWGTTLLSGDTTDVVRAPLLWWSCFAQSVFAWSWITTGVAGLMLMTVVTLVATTGGPKRETRAA